MPLGDLRPEQAGYAAATREPATSRVASRVVGISGLHRLRAHQGPRVCSDWTFVNASRPKKNRGIGAEVFAVEIESDRRHTATTTLKVAASRGPSHGRKRSSRASAMRPPSSGSTGTRLTRPHARLIHFICHEENRHVESAHGGSRVVANHPDANNPNSEQQAIKPNNRNPAAGPANEIRTERPVVSAGSRAINGQSAEAVEIDLWRPAEGQRRQRVPHLVHENRNKQTADPDQPTSRDARWLSGCQPVISRPARTKA